LGRMAWARLNGLLLISGAFGAFDKRVAVSAGGYNHKTVGEDMELVVRMRRYMEEKKQPYKITYIPDPLCWTEAPTTAKILGRQRNRWIRGTIETLKFHKRMFFNPTYGLLGMVSYPYWFFFEMLAPVIEFFGFIVFLIMAMAGLIYWPVFFSLLLFIISFGYLYSAFAAYMEATTYNMYRRRRDMMTLLLTALTEPFIFHPFVVWAAIKGYVDILRKKNTWGEMTRQGFAAAAAPEKIKTSAWNKLRQATSSFVSRGVIATILFILIRSYEVISNGALHGYSKLFTSSFLYGIASDISFLLRLSVPLYVLYVLIFFLHKKTANTLVATAITIICVIQFALVQYFLNTLVMLGGDLWSYSWNDIKQTVGASGTFMQSVFMLLLSIVLIAGLFILLIKYIRINATVSFAVSGILLMAAFVDPVKYLTRNIEGNEYEKNLVLNKSYFFYKASLEHFFPTTVDADVYAINDIAYKSADAEYRYVDQEKYPFLRYDETPDVLSPFFDSTSIRPNIVILVVEGLGRAFTNKGAYLGNFTPFLDSLAAHSLYWENFLSEGGRTFAVLPSMLGSLPFAKNGFNELSNKMPDHLSLVNILKHNGYHTSFYYGGDASFDKMDLFLRKNNIDAIHDVNTFPKNYSKLPANSGGFSWGYGDKELYRRYFETAFSSNKPNLNVLLTIATHSPFLVNDQAYYDARFEKRINELGFNKKAKSRARMFKSQFASILYCDDALNEFFTEYAKREDFGNTIFLITGDHRMPEIPMSTKLDRYHVPLIMYSPLLQRSSAFKSISTHFDIAPTLLAFLKNHYLMDVPNMASWVGSGIDTARNFRNVHAYPLMQTKDDAVDFVKGDKMINGPSLYEIKDNMDLEPLENVDISKQLNADFLRFKQRNNSLVAGKKLIPDSLYQRYNTK
jgi:peptidoglycan-N-acetylglucosamine deacetylase